jgi:hypothetical protein
MTPPHASLTVPTSEVLHAIWARRNNGLDARTIQASNAFFIAGSWDWNSGPKGTFTYQ